MADNIEEEDDDLLLGRSSAKIIPPPPPTPPVADDGGHLTAQSRADGILRSLRAYGYAPLAPPTSAAHTCALEQLKAALRAAARAAATDDEDQKKTSSLLQNGRVAANLSRDACGAEVAAYLSDSSVSPVAAAVASYLRADASDMDDDSRFFAKKRKTTRRGSSAIVEVQGVQDIAVRPRCPPQELHRDHSLGRGVAVVLALSLDDAPLKTEFVRGTHLAPGCADTDVDEDDPLSAYVGRYRYSTRRRPLADVMAKHLEASGQLKAVDAPWMLYDPFTYHRGAASLTFQSGRIFIMLCASHLEAKLKTQICKTNDIKRRWDLPLSSTIVPAVVVPRSPPPFSSEKKADRVDE